MSSILNIKPGVPLIRNSAKNTTQASPYYGVLKLSASLARSDLRPLFQALVCYLYGIPSVVLLYDANIRCRQPQKYPHSIHGFSHGQVFWQLSDEFVYKWGSYINWYLMTLTRTWRSLIIQNMRYMDEYSYRWNTTDQDKFVFVWYLTIFYWNYLHFLSSPGRL